MNVFFATSGHLIAVQEKPFIKRKSSRRSLKTDQPTLPGRGAKGVGAGTAVGMRVAFGVGVAVGIGVAVGMRSVVGMGLFTGDVLGMIACEGNAVNVISCTEASA